MSFDNFVWKLEGSSTETGEPNDVVHHWRLSLYGTDDEAEEVLLSALSFNAVDLHDAEGFDAYDAESQDMALLYHLVCDDNGDLDNDRFGTTGPSWLILCLDENELPTEYRSRFMKKLANIFYDCFIVVAPKTEEEKRDYVNLAFQEIIPRRPVVIETMPQHDIDDVSEILDEMLADPAKRWMWNSSEFNWDFPVEKRMA